MTERTKKLISRTGLAIVLMSLPTAAVASAVLNDHPPPWVLVAFIAGVLIAALPDLFATKVKNQ